MHGLTPACIDLVVPVHKAPELEAALPAAVMSLRVVSDHDVKVFKSPEGCRCRVQIFDHSSVLAVLDAVQKAVKGQSGSSMLHSLLEQYTSGATVQVFWPIERMQSEIHQLYPAYELTSVQLKDVNETLSLSRRAHQAK